MKPERKKKVDHEALMSPFSRIPGLNLASARLFIDLGIRTVDELRGRSPEVLFDQLRSLPQHRDAPRDQLYAIRLAVYYAENDPPDSSLLQIWHWAD
jgi:hypothetical protein